MKQDSLARLFSWVLLNSDSAVEMKKQQFEISPTDSARRKLENLQNSLILKTLLNFIANIWIYMPCLFEQFFFLTWLYFLFVVQIGSERDESLPHVLRRVRGGKYLVLCILKIWNLYIYIYVHHFVEKGKVGEKHTLNIKHNWIVTVTELFQN